MNEHVSPKGTSFPLASTIEITPGTEAAQAAFPYFMQPNPGDDKKFWFYNAMHFPRPMCPFDSITAEGAYLALGASNTRVNVLPTAKGIEFRMINGRVYIGGIPVTDPDEIAERSKEFEQRAFYYFEHWDRLYAQWKDKMAALIEAAEKRPAPELPTYQPLDQVHAGRGIALNHDVIALWHETVEGYLRMWQHHFEFLLLGYGAYLVFFDFCKSTFPEIEERAVAQMVQGIESEMFRPDEELKKLARKAVELGVDDVFEHHDPGDILSALDTRGDAGRAWLDALAQARDPWFNVNTGDGFYHDDLSWQDDLSVPFSAIAGYLPKARAGETLLRPLEEVRRERDAMIEEYRALLESDDQRAAFDQMLGLAHNVFPYVEGHKFYCEHWYTNVFFNKVREFGALLADHGFFGNAEDIFMLTRFEVEQALSDLCLAWSAGGNPTGPDYWPAKVAERHDAVAAWADADMPPALGPLPSAVEDPAIRLLWGINEETLESWLNAGNEDPNVIRGTAASAGTVEGTARVISSIKDMDQLGQGDILVCKITNPSWAPVFHRIAAAVSDIGGSMSHAAIVAREYNLPAVVGTGDGSRRIKDGQRIRVDGARGIVTILEDA